MLIYIISISGSQPYVNELCLSCSNVHCVLCCWTN